MRHRDIIDVAQPTRPYFDAIAADCAEVVAGYARHHAYGEAASFQRQMISALDAMLGDTIGTAWRKAVRAQAKNPRAATAWKARALNLDAEDPHMSVALACFAPFKAETWMLAVPLPIPCPMGPKFAEPEDIVLIDPATGAAALHSGDTDTLIRCDDADRFSVMADAKAWAREIAASAVEWFYRREQAHRVANIAPAWLGAPSALAIGSQEKIAWPRVTAITAGDGIDAARLKKAIFRQTRITHVESAMQIGRAA